VPSCEFIQSKVDLPGLSPRGWYTQCMTRQRRPDGTFMPAKRAATSSTMSHHGSMLDDDDIGDAEPKLDSWSSELTGLGARSHDKRESNHFAGRSIAYLELARLWEKDALIAKAIEAPSEGALRPGFEIEISDEGKFNDLKEDLEGSLEELELEEALDVAYCYKRCYGGGAILLGTNDSRPLEAPLDPKANTPVTYLDTFEPIELVPYSLYDDPHKPNYRKVELYQLQNITPSLLYGGIKVKDRKTSAKPKKSQRGDIGVLIHASRLIVFNGVRTSRFILPHNGIVSPYWGSSLVPRFYDAVRDFEVAFNGVGLMMNDVGQPVIAMKNLREMIAKGGGKLRDRLQAIELSRSTARAIAIDADGEKYERQVTQLAGIPDTLDRMSQRTAADIGIPLSVLIGYSPATLGQSDDAEMTLWNNALRLLERKYFRRPIKRVAAMNMRSMRQRKLPKHWDATFNELEHMTTPQRIEAERVQAQTDSLVIKSGIVTPDEIRKARYRGGYSFRTTINESAKAPGFIAPLPAGLLPKGMSAEQAITAIEAGEKPGSPAMAKAGQPGAAVHSVTPYTRRAPRSTAGTASPGAGATAAGDGGGARRDAADPMPGTAEYEVAYQKSRQEKAKASGANDDKMKLMDEIVRLAEAEAEECRMGTCGPECIYDHENQDGDQPVELTMFAGIRVGIESLAGSTRTWTDSDGNTGTTTMKYAYGYIMTAEGADGDSLDAYFGPDESAAWAYVVRQMRKSSDFQQYDEDKVMLGFASPDAARAAYLEQYSDPRFFGGMTMVPVQEFVK
jgi:phage-related protein (TIGR01555 family)